MTDQEPIFPMMSMEEFEAKVEAHERWLESYGIMSDPVIAIDRPTHLTEKPWRFFFPQHCAKIMAKSLNDAGARTKVDYTVSLMMKKDGSYERGSEVLASMGLPDWANDDGPAIVETVAPKDCVRKLAETILSSPEVEKWDKTVYTPRSYTQEEWEASPFVHED
jgi:hypothetical protein